MDQGGYVASESSFYRVLRKNGQQYRRGKVVLRTHIARGPCEVGCWYIHRGFGSSSFICTCSWICAVTNLLATKCEEESGAHAVTGLQRVLLNEQYFNKPLAALGERCAHEVTDAEDQA